MHNPHTVIVLLEASPGKESELQSALETVTQYSRAEPHNITYQLHQSTDNPLLFILYEQWQSKELHQTQFEKAYIKAFAEKAKLLLSKEPQVISALEIDPTPAQTTMNTNFFMDHQPHHAQPKEEQQHENHCG